MGLDKRFVADVATPCTVFPATFAIPWTVCPAAFETAPIELSIEDVTDPTSCPGIEIRLFSNPPVVEMIYDGNPRMLSNIVLYIVK